MMQKDVSVRCVINMSFLVHGFLHTAVDKSQQQVMTIDYQAILLTLFMSILRCLIIAVRVDASRKNSAFADVQR